jgi:molybdopterin-guanine dinucleotide biosynthesis protein A
MGSYYITEEKDARSDTDTGRMLAAGAKRVLWLLALKTHLEDGVRALLETLDNETVSICESNRARTIIEPGVFVMLKGARDKTWKPSAREVVAFADRIVSSDAMKLDIDLNDIQLIDGQWAIKMPATAILLAGGDSTRMGQDKAMLPIGGQPMIKHVYEQLQPHFSQILVSLSNASLHDFLGVTVVADEVAGRGPLVGIASALKASASNVNFVMACDMPEIDAGLIRAMLRQVGDYDAIVPKVGPELYEPLFAVYKKSALPAIEQVLKLGSNRVIDCFYHCRVKYIDLPSRHFRNINTKAEYRGLVEEKTDAGI